MSQIENMAQDDAATVANIASEGMQGLQAQIRSAMRRVSGDDLSTRFLNNALESTETLLADIIIQYNQDIDDYNRLSDELENKSTAINLALKRIEELEQAANGASEELREEYEKRLFQAQGAADVLEREKINLQSRVDDMEIAMRTMRSQYNDLRKECKRLMDMEPEKKIKQLAEYKKEVHELRAQVRTLSNQVTAEQKERTRLSREAQTLAEGLETLRSHNTLLASDVKKINGASQYDWDVTNQSGEHRKFWLHRYAYGISNKPGMNDTIPKTLYAVPFSYIVFSCRGYGVNVLPNEWCAPLYNPFSEFEADKPEDFDQVMESVFESELESIYPKLVERARWARTVPVADVPGMSAKALKLLEGSHYKTLFDVVRTSPLRLLNIKGIGKGIAAEIGKACLHEVYNWMEKNGTIEDLKKIV